MSDVQQVMGDRDVQLRRRFRLATLIVSVVFIAELVGGFLTNSLALLSDAAHVFADVFALAMSWAAISLASRPPTERSTFGYHRIEIFAAMINALSLLVIAGMIAYEAIHRFIQPEQVLSLQMLIIATVGLAANLSVAVLLQGDDRSNLNVRSARLHVIGDALASVGVIVGGVVMLVTGWYIVDPIISVGIAALLVAGGSRVAAQSGRILLEGTPPDLSLASIREAIESIPGVQGTHDIHVWSLCSDYRALSAHVEIQTQSTDDTHSLLQAINAILWEKFRIAHTALQFESVACKPQAHLHDLPAVTSTRLHSH